MDVSLEVLTSTNIKQKKPCPRICWLGQEKESVFLLDKKHLSEINLRSGSLKKIAPRLQALLKKKNIVTLSTSLNGAWLVGLVLSGELFIWNKDRDSLQTAPANDEIAKEVTAAQELSWKVSLCASGDGRRVLVATPTGCVFLWESTEKRHILLSSKSTSVAGTWTQIQPLDSTVFPKTTDKEAMVHAIFVKNETLGDCCLCTFVSYAGERLMMTFLALRWCENNQKYNSSLPYCIRWAQQACSLASLVPPACEPVKSRGALLAAFSRDGLVLAITVNQRDPKATRVLFVNTMNFVTISGHLRGCSSKEQPIPCRFIRSYWVGDMTWTADSLFLACVLKRGALILLTRLGELLTLTTSGCSVEFGPAEFIPLHPLISYRAPLSAPESCGTNNSLGSSVSESDLLRQRYSVTCHPRLPYLIVSDGYMVTALRFAKNMSPYHFMKSLLLDSAQRLKTVRQRQEVKKAHGIKLRSLSSLKASLLKDSENPYSTMSTVPSFLHGEEETCEPIEQATLRGDEEESDDPDLPINTHFSSARAEQGRLEFASMFDTIHASDHRDGQSNVSSELHHIQKALCAAWAVGVTMRNLEEKDTLLNYTVGCLTHFLSVLQHAKCPTIKSDQASKKVARGGSPWVPFLKVFQQCLTVLYWDIAPGQAVRHIIKLTSEAIKLILVQHQQLYSKSLLESFCLLKVVSRHLVAIYTLHYEALPVSPGINRAVCIDSLKNPLFEAPVTSSLKGWSAGCLFKQPPEPVNLTGKSEKRLAVLWRFLYNQTLWYQARLRQHMFINQNQMTHNVRCEEDAIGSLLCHIQAELQSAGEHLDQSLHLMPVTGEEYFLLGSYKESVEFWKSALLEISDRGGRRASFLQTRYYLAVLYCHLYNYNLNDAQGMCDQLVRELLSRSQLLPGTMPGLPGGSECEQRLLNDVHPDAALAVIQSMGRFMAAFFTNQLLYVFPPHSVGVLPPLHTAADRFSRVVTLQHSAVASAVRDQNLSSAWNVEYALDLLLVGGLLPEAAWMANTLGDWKMAVTMGVAYNLYRENIPDELERKEWHMPWNLTPARIFLDKLQSFLGRPPSSETWNKDCSKHKQFTDPIEEEDADLLFSSLQEMLKAAVMADAEILAETFHQLMESAKDLSTKLSGLVPERLYLPAPPLYCPQPASVSDGDPGDLPLEAEKRNRQRLSGVLQRILLLLRAAHCSLPAAQWYIKQIKQARKVMQKIRAKGSLPPLHALPETLLNYSNSSTIFFKPGPGGDHQTDQVSCTIIGYFRELCALCWMLHVRERLSYSCRQYQKARDNGKLFKTAEEYDSCVTEHCYNALEWACRTLPFTRITNCEELVQDIILSLVSELPPVRKVAEILVKAFPHPEDVRVPLREKYHSVHQRLRHSMVKGLQGEEMMSVIIHEVLRSRVKTLRRVQRNIGPVEMHIWETALEETLDEDLHCYDRFSLGTSLSRSTLTDIGRPHVYSDADTLSEALLNEDADQRTECHIAGNKCVKNTRDNKPAREKVRPKAKASKGDGLVLPKVGTWEFESDDEEYTKFLDLFLSYLLERDLLHYSDPGIPFLTAFSQHLREHELNSLVFDVHTTLKRKLGRTRTQSVFQAGCCYTVNVEPRDESGKSESTLVQTLGTPDPLSNSALVVVVEKPEASSAKYFHKLKTRNAAKSGLFGLKEQRTQKSNEGCQKLPPRTCGLSTHDQYSHKLIQNRNVMPSEELGGELQAKFSREAKLVEWMVRWADRRLYWSAGKAELCQAHSTAIRVKTSSAALLTSLWLLEKPYLGSSLDENLRFKVPPREYIVAPMFQPVAGAKLQSETSVDSDNPESDGDSVSVLEEHAHEQLEESVSEESSNLSEVNKESSPERRLPSPSEDKSVGYGAPAEEIKDPVMEPILIPSDTEDEQDEQLDTQRSLNISISIRPKQQQQQQEENLPSEFDVCPQSPEAPVSQKMWEQPQNGESAVASSVGPVVLQPFPTAASVPSADPASTNPPRSQQTAPPLNTSEAVRQLFQDEMFRLLQLQQINFMSIMQVVGSSFATLPTMQQILQQSSQMGRNLVVNSAGGHAAAQLQTPLPAETQACAFGQTTERQNGGTDMGKPGKSSICAGGETKALRDQSNKENNLPGASIPVSQANNGEKIPASQGLLTTAPSHGLPVIVPSSVIHKTPTLIPAAKGLSNVNGFPLLKLQPEPRFTPLNIFPRNMTQDVTRSAAPPLPREAWAPSDVEHKSPKSHISRDKSQVPAHAVLHKDDIKVIMRAKERKKWAETVNEGLSKHATMDQYTSQPSVPVQLQRPKRHENISYRPTPHNAAGIPLLQLHADPVPYFPPIVGPDVRVPVLPPQYKVKAVSLATLPQAALTLLKSSVPQETQSFRVSPAYQAPKLIPLQNLLAFEHSCQSRDERSTAAGTLQLLKANIAPFQEAVTPSDSIKRQKRRTQQQQKDEKTERRQEKKAAVTFRPEDSIINTNHSGEIIQIESTQHDEPRLQHGNEFVIPLGSFESLLSEQISGRRIPSVAELHYVASTKKRAPQIQDASTNTDPVISTCKNTGAACEEVPPEIPSNQLLASASESLPSNIPQLLPPDVYLNLRFPSEGQGERAAPQQASDLPTTHVGHHYINVIDIDAKDLLWDLPDTAAWEAPSREKNDSQRVPSSAELHHMAASVTNAVPPDQFQSRESFLRDISGQRQKLEEQGDHAADSVTYDMLFGNAPPAERVTRPAAKAPGKDRAVCRLQEMDIQLTALQTMADNMERDFVNTELLVNTIENLATAINPNSENATYTSRGAGVTERALHLSRMGLEDLTEEDEDFKLPRPAVIHPHAHSPAVIHPHAHSPAVIHPHAHSPAVITSSRNRPRDTQPPAASGQNKNVNKSLLDVTGLSDIADILGDLMEGGVSASELGLTENQATKFSRERRQIGSLRHTSKRTEKERRELQMWMKRKQAERLGEHRRRLNGLRELEHDPFQLAQSANTSVSSKTMKQSQRVKDERDKNLLSEHHSHRMSDALSLMQEMLSEAKQIPAAEPKAVPSISKTPISKAQGFRSSPKGSSAAKRSLSASRVEKRRSLSKAGFFQPRSLSSPPRAQSRGTAAVVLQKSTWNPKIRATSAPSYPVHLKYDASLPGDRMSQITRRGMLATRNRTNANRQTSTNPLLHSAARRTAPPRQDVRHKGTSFKPEELDPDEEMERDVMSPWEVPDEINKLLNSNRNSTLSQGSLLHEDDASPHLPKVDNSSESTGSLLSKLDWNAIEDMVASLEES
ncbi:ciliogenesis and planar polarity effector 1 isoform X2 [Ascaphus truei]|uniref:ciliogenesis and planar polarity effector 1 isoform X2 n=1 Tax=Ascaphus truei TaxID=8439 RepID=UPI003F594C7C